MMKPMDQYVFTPAERAYFAPRMQELMAQQLVLRNAVALIIGQQSLDGMWRVADDGSGLVRVAEAAAPVAAETPSSSPATP